MPCSDPIIAMLAPFRPLFTAPTRKKMEILLRGTLLARGRRTVTAALRQMGHHQDPNFSTFHHVLNRARWAPLKASRYLLTLILETFGQAGGTLDVVIDETLERRWGAQIRKRGHYRDGALSSLAHSVSSPGLRWIVLAVVVTLPWTRQRWAFALSVYPGHHPGREREARNPPQNGRHAGTSTRQFAPPLVAGGPDQAHGRYGLQHLGTGTALRQTPVHVDCPLSSGLATPPASSGAQPTHSGRPRVVGQRLPSLEHLLQDPQTAWRRLTLTGMARASGQWSCVREPPAGIALGRLSCPFAGCSPVILLENGQRKRCFPPTRRSLLRRFSPIS